MNTLEWTEIVAGMVRVGIAVVIGYGVHHLARRVQWPSRTSGRSRVGFAFIHLAAALSGGMLGFFLSSATEGVITGLPVEAGPDEFLIIGFYLYVVIAGATYTVEATRRTARAEAAAAQMQVAALRAQIQPHFLFNALHAVVQLIPIDPARAMNAAELVAELLRATMEDDRDVISLREEWAFVSRYVELEQMRFGDRLRVRADVNPDLMDVGIPSFALQTLVENAVRHGAAPRIGVTDVVVTAAGNEKEVTLSVRNTGEGDVGTGNGVGTGTGLNRLRERLVALHGTAAQLTHGVRADGDYEAVLVLPRSSA